MRDRDGRLTVRDRGGCLAVCVIDRGPDLVGNVLHEGSTTCHVEYLDATADREQRQIRFDGSARKLQLVVITARLGCGIGWMSGLTIDRGQHIPSASEQQSIH